MSDHRDWHRRFIRVTGILGIVLTAISLFSNLLVLGFAYLVSVGVFGFLFRSLEKWVQQTGKQSAAKAILVGSGLLLAVLLMLGFWQIAVWSPGPFPFLPFGATEPTGAAGVIVFSLLIAAIGILLFVLIGIVHGFSVIRNANSTTTR